MKWSFYNNNTGLFAPHIFHGGPSLVSVNTPADFTAIEGEFDHLSKRFDFETGEVVDYVPDAPPNDEMRTWEYSDISKRWRPVATLLALKLMKWEEIKAAASVSDDSLLTVGQYTLQADDASKAALYSAAQAALIAVSDGEQFQIEWVLADNTVVTVGPAQLKAVVKALQARTSAIKTKAQQLRQQIEAAADEAALQSIAWSWP